MLRLRITTSLFLCLYSFITNAQEKQTLPVLPVDSATNIITYRSIVDKPKVKSDELYSKAREWFAISFKSAKNVLEMDDRTAGKLIGKGEFSFVKDLVSRNMAIPITYTIGFTVSISIKDYKYRVILSDYTLSINNGKSSPLEVAYNKMRKDASEGKPSSDVINTMFEIDRRSIEIVNSLRKSLDASVKDDF